jgi:phage/plasmid-like protein (TIGR03299 family)
MSRETSEWRNRYFLIGQTDQRGHAWHYRKSDQGDEPNHYPGFIPVDDVARRLFPAEVLLVPTAVARPAQSGEHADYTDANGQRFVWVLMARKGVIPGDQVIEAGEDGYDPLGLHGLDYVSHQYRDWLLDNVANLLDDDLGITSAGLVRGGRVAWVEVSVPDAVQTAEGFPFRRSILCFTSHNGDYRTTYKKSATAVVCDNTFGYAADWEHEAGIYRIGHTRASTDEARVADARTALGIIFASGDELSRRIAADAAHKVSEAEFAKVLDKLAPPPEPDATLRSTTYAENRRAKLIKLWTDDERATPWKGTRLGVLQTFSTYGHHEQWGATNLDRRSQRNSLRMLTGHYAKSEALVRSVLADVQR